MNPFSEKVLGGQVNSQETSSCLSGQVAASQIQSEMAAPENSLIGAAFVKVRGKLTMYIAQVQCQSTQKQILKSEEGANPWQRNIFRLCSRFSPLLIDLFSSTTRIGKTIR